VYESTPSVTIGLETFEEHPSEASAAAAAVAEIEPTTKRTRFMPAIYSSSGLRVVAEGSF
jgi:hypothetical protein